jgi:DNA (cytosine-5)-methyltransferase 1
MRQGKIKAEARFDKISGCLRTPRGGSSRQIVLRLGSGKAKVRHMTAREYGRLQGVEDTFKVVPNTINALFGFGDAVCVPAVRWVAKNLLNPIADEINANAYKLNPDLRQHAAA